MSRGLADLSIPSEISQLMPKSAYQGSRIGKRGGSRTRSIVTVANDRAE